MNRTAATAFSLLVCLTGTALAAGDAYQCENGTTLVYKSAPREMQIHGLVEGFVVALPFATSGGRRATWSTRPPAEIISCDDDAAPCVEYWQPASGPVVVFYMLEPGQPEVNCRPK